MPVNQKITNWIKSSNDSGLMLNFLQGLAPQEEEKFWNWFTINANKYVVENYDYNFRKPKSLAGNCYDNAQTNAIKFDLNYCEGAYDTEMGSNLILHGFNVKNEYVLDFTVIMNTVDGLYHDQIPPEQYYGVIIPNKFVERQLSESDSANDNPLLVKYFKYINLR